MATLGVMDVLVQVLLYRVSLLSRVADCKGDLTSTSRRARADLVKASSLS